MKIGVILLPEPSADTLIARARLASKLGFDYIGVGDVPGAGGELYTTLGLLAGAGLNAAIGPMVTNLVSRHPRVTAAAVNALDRASAAGAFLGVGRGGSPLADLGLPKPTSSLLEQGVRDIRDHLAEFGARVPVLVSAYGPQTLRLSGAAGDGVIIAGGTSPEYLRTAMSTVRDAAESAGRAPDEIAMTLLARVSIADSRADAVRAIRSLLASAGANNLRSRSELEQYPADVQERLAELRRRYDVRAGVHAAAEGDNAQLIDELGLSDLLADRFAVAGTTDEIGRRLVEFEASGISTVFVPVIDKDPERLLEQLAGARDAGTSTAET